VVVEIFIAQRQPVYALRDQTLQRVFRLFGLPMVRKAMRESGQDSALPVHLAEQQTTRIGGNVATIKTGDHLASAELMGCAT
jgi:fructose 1,6-bisphosphatase